MKKSMTRSFQPSIESLEDRALMTAELLGDTVRIEATESADQVVVSLEDMSVRRRSRRGFRLVEEVVVRENGVVTGHWARSKVDLIEFYGKGGNDYFRNDTDIRAYAEGGLGADFLLGGSVTDEFYGGDNNDTLVGRGGLDYLDGEAGNDWLDGGYDGFADELRGGANADTFVFEGNGFSLFGGSNRDQPLDFNTAEGDKIDSGLFLSIA